jgi:hypothetical protein
MELVEPQDHYASDYQEQTKKNENAAEVSHAAISC